MIKEITELHHGKSTNPDIPVAAALHVLILPCSNGETRSRSYINGCEGAAHYE